MFLPVDVLAGSLPGYRDFEYVRCSSTGAIYRAVKCDSQSSIQTEPASHPYISSNESTDSLNSSLDTATNMLSNRTTDRSVMSAESKQSPDIRVSIKLIASVDASGRWCGPSRSQMQALKMQFDTLKIAEQRGVPHFVRPVELKQVQFCQSSDVSSMQSDSTSLASELVGSHSRSRSQLISISNDHPSTIQLTHPNMHPVANSFTALIMISHWCPGETLSRLSAAPRYRDGWPLCELLSIAIQLCSALSAIHKESITRRGFSTDQIIYDPLTGSINLLDFGLPVVSAFDDSSNKREQEDNDPLKGQIEDDADDLYVSPSLRHERLTDRPVSCSKSSLNCVSPNQLLPLSSITSTTWKNHNNFLWRCFQAPETGLLFSRTDVRNDLWSLGVTLYSLLTGRLPFLTAAISDPLDLSHAVLTRNTPSVTIVKPYIPVMLSEIIARCLHKQPPDRYQSAQGVMSDLCRVYQQIITFAHSKHLSHIIPSAMSRLPLPSSPSDATTPSYDSLAKQIESELVITQSDPSLTSVSPSDTHHSTPSDQVNALFQFCTGQSLLPTDQQLGIMTEPHPEVFVHFVCGREDQPSKLFLSDRLYGREEQWKTLFDALVGVILHGGCRVIFIRGIAGSGKTALAKEMLNDLTSKYRSCLVLKSHLDLQTSPFSMWKPCINDLIFNIFQQPSSDVAQWRARIIAALNGMVPWVAELFPVLSRLIGTQKHKPEANQTEGRVTTAILAMLSAFCLGAKRPLLFLFDDIQRADPCSLSLLEAFVRSIRTQHVAVIATYRSEDVSSSHPLSKFLANLNDMDVPVTDIKTAPLSLNDITSLVADALHTSTDKALPIAQHMLSKSRGNAFYVRQLLLQMHRDNQLVFKVFSPMTAIRQLHQSNNEMIGEWRLASPATLARTLSSSSGSPRGVDSGWSTQSANDIKSLIQYEVKRLENYRILSLAAFLGNHVIVSDLVLVCEQDENKVLEVLLEAAQHNLLEMSQVSDPDSLFLESTSPSSVTSTPQSHVTEFSAVFTFTHDLVQQACLSLIPQSEVETTHLKIAEKFYHQAAQSHAFMISYRFRIAGHLISAFRSIESRTDEARQWARFLSETALEADSLSSYVLGLQYATVAQILLGLEEALPSANEGIAIPVKVISSKRSQFYASEWERDFELARSLTYLRAKLEYLNSRCDESERQLLDALEHITNDLDRVDFFIGLQEVHSSCGRFDDAMQINRQALRMFDCSLPQLDFQPSFPDADATSAVVDIFHLGNRTCNAELVTELSNEFQNKLQGRSIGSLIDTLPECDDRRILAIGSLLASILPSCYLSSRRLAEVVCLICAISMLEYGLQGSSSHPLSQLGAFYLSVPELVRRHQPEYLGDLGVAVSKKLHNCEPWLECRCLLINGLIQQIYKGFSCCERWMIECRYSGLEKGGQLFVSFSLFVQCTLRSWTFTLPNILKDLEKARLSNQRLAKEVVTDLNLQGDLMGLLVLSDPRFADQQCPPCTKDESDFLERSRQFGPVASLGFVVTRARSLYILNHPEVTLELLSGVKMSDIMGIPQMIEVALLKPLAIAMMVRRRNLVDSTDSWKTERENMLMTAWEDVNLMQAWAEVNPSTFMCMYNLCCAEIAFANVVGATGGTLKQIRSRREETELIRITSLYKSCVVGFSSGLREKVSESQTFHGHVNSSLLEELVSQSEGPTESIWFIGVANERAAEFSLLCNRYEAAVRFAMTSLRKWEQYACEVKVKQILRDYSQVTSSVFHALGIIDALGTNPLTQNFSARPLSQPASLTTPSFVAGIDAGLASDKSNSLDQSDLPFDEMDPYYDVSSSFATGDVDLKTVIRSTQAISSEIVLPRLLALVIKNVIRVSGAERAILFSLSAPSSLGDDDNRLWDVDAMLDIRESDQVYIRPSLLVQSQADPRSGSPEPSATAPDPGYSDAYPHSILNFVVHSQHPIILANACEDTTFGRDPYIQRTKVRSLLCLPLMQRGGLTQALYLDNCTSTGLFRKERLLVAKLIAAQAAISIDNSLLYERVTRYSRSLETRVAQRTHELEIASKQAQAANIAKSSFTQNMSSEVRTPMQCCIGAIDLLADPATSSNLTGEQKEILNIVRSSANSMLSIVSDVLDLSKIESGTVQLIARPFALREAIESAMDVLASKCMSKGVELQAHIDLNVPYEITADSKRLTQVIFNLLSNSIKFTMQGSITLGVSVERDDPNEQQDDDHNYLLHFSCADSGLGIPKELQSQLFKPFSQVHTDTARVITGTGLGLVISKHIVEMMDGQIWVESDVTQRKGSTFHFTIKCNGSDSKRPVHLQNRVDIQTATVVQTPAEHPKQGILLVHPCPLTCEWLKQITSHWNIHAECVSTLGKAIEVISTHSGASKLFAVFVDYRMMSTVTYIDVETDQPVSGAVPRPTGLQLDSQARSIEKVYQRYTIDAELVTQTDRLIQQCCKLTGRSATVPKLIITGPISLQGVIRTIFKAVNQPHYAFVSSPIKVATLFQTLYNAIQPSSPAIRSSQSSSASAAGSKHEVSTSKKSFCAMDLVLVVEDNNVNRKIYNRMLLALGFRDNQIQTAVNGQVGLNTLLRWVDRNSESSDSSSESKSDKPRTRVCLLLDSVMPIMTGPECARSIRSSPQIPSELQPYIIALTANASVDDKENCLASGMDEYLTKPITLDELQQALERGAREGHHAAI